MKQLLIIGTLVLTMGGCANSDLYSGDVYSAGHAKRVQSVSYGIIVNARPVKIQAEGKTPLFGGMAGASLGGILGHTLGGGHGQSLATVAGGIGGAIIGEKISDRANKISGLELEIKQEDGKSIVVVQKFDPRLVVGQRVRIVSDGEDVNVSAS